MTKAMKNLPHSVSGIFPLGKGTVGRAEIAHCHVVIFDLRPKSQRTVFRRFYTSFPPCPPVANNPNPSTMAPK